MKLTPLDIHHKEFRHSLRGYNEEEVDQFLDEVADEFERLFKENVDQSERLDALQAKINEFELQRQTINNTLVAAQRSADDIIARAQAEADSIVTHANTRSKEIVNDALAKKQNVRGEVLRLKQAEEEFRERYKSLLETNLRAITEIGVADDVNMLLGESEQSVDDVLGAGPAAAAPVQAPMPAPARPAAPAPAPEPQMRPVAQPAPQMPTAEPPSPGFVQAVALGELDAPQLPPDVDLIEPSEFAMPGFDALGEREDDMDIEEID